MTVLHSFTVSRILVGGGVPSDWGSRRGESGSSPAAVLDRNQRNCVLFGFEQGRHSLMVAPTFTPATRTCRWGPRIESSAFGIHRLWFRYRRLMAGHDSFLSDPCLHCAPMIGNSMQTRGRKALRYSISVRGAV